MLTYLRTQSKSWIIKTILAVMAVGLAFFYGYGSFRRGDNTSGEAVATINGETISVKRYTSALKSQLAIYSQMYGGEIPDFLETMIKTNLLDQLVEERLIHQWAVTTGVPVAKEEIAKKILANEQFIKEGKFDAEFYKTKFRPWFHSEYGLDYEAALKEDLQTSKAVEALISATAKSAPALEDISQALSTHRYHLKQIAVSPAALTAAEAKQADTKTDAATGPTDADAKALASIVLHTLPDEAKVKALLKPYGIEIIDLGEVPLSDWRQMLPQTADAEALPIIQALLKLNADNPVPDEPFKVGDTYYVYRFVAATITPAAPESADEADQQRFSRLLQPFLVDSLHQQATIELNKEAL